MLSSDALWTTNSKASTSSASLLAPNQRDIFVSAADNKNASTALAEADVLVSIEAEQAEPEHGMNELAKDGPRVGALSRAAGDDPDRGAESESEDRAGGPKDVAGDRVAKVQAESIYPDIFDTSDDYESAVDQASTEMEVLIDAQKSKARAKLIAKSKSDNVIQFREQQVVTLKIPKKYRTGVKQSACQ